MEDKDRDRDRQRDNGRRRQDSDGRADYTTTFFVSNLPKGVSRGRLWREFVPFGMIFDAYVARKRDIRGNVFAFVRFTKVLCVESLLIVLNKVKLDGVKISVNVARFKKGSKPPASGRSKEDFQLPGEVNVEKTTHNTTRVNNFCSSVTRTYGKSYCDALKGGQHFNQHHELVYQRNSESDALIDWKGCSLIGVSHDLKSLNILKSSLKMENLEGIHLRYVSGLKVLLSFSSNDLAQEFLTQRNNLWMRWFQSLAIWKGQDIEFDRIAWIQVSGVPIYFWDKDIFNEIGRKFGTVVLESQASVKDDCLAFERLGILVKDGRKIDEELTVKWRNSSFKCWISEIAEDWMPNFLPDKVTTSSFTKANAQSETTPAFEEGVNFSTPDVLNVGANLVSGKASGSGVSSGILKSPTPLFGDDVQQVQPPSKDDGYVFHNIYRGPELLRVPVSGENSVYTPEPEKNDGTGGGVRFAESSDKTKDRVDYLDREHEDDVSAEETGDNDISVREKELGVCGLSNHMTQKSPNLVDSICSRTTNGSEHRVCADRSIGSDIDLVLTPPPSGFNGLGEGLENTDWALDGLFQSNGPAPSTPEAQVQVVSDPSLDSDPFNLMELIEQQDMEEILPDLNNEPSMELVPTKTIDTKKKKKGLKSNKKGPPHSLKLKNIIWSSKSVSTPRLISRLNYEDSAEIEDEVIQNPIGINKSKEDLEWEVHKTIELGEILGFRITGHEKNIRAMIIEEQEQIGEEETSIMMLGVYFQAKVFICKSGV